MDLDWGFGLRCPNLPLTSLFSNPPLSNDPCQFLDAAIFSSRFFIFLTSSRFRQPQSAHRLNSFGPLSPWALWPIPVSPPLQGHGRGRGCVPGSGCWWPWPAQVQYTASRVPFFLRLRGSWVVVSRLQEQPAGHVSTPLPPPMISDLGLSALLRHLCSAPIARGFVVRQEVLRINLAAVPNLVRDETPHPPPTAFSLEHFASSLLFSVIPLQYSGVALRSGSLVTRRLANQSPRGF